MNKIHEGGLQPAGSFPTHLDEEQYTTPVQPDDGPNPLKPTPKMGCDPTSGETFQKNFVEQGDYSTAGTGSDVRSGFDRVPTEINWNKMK